MAMQYSREVLNDGGRVIWVCENSPDPGRFSQLFEDVSVVFLAKLHLMACGEGLTMGIQTSAKLTERLSPQLVVIDDWTPRTGQADKMAISAIKDIMQLLEGKNCPILIISSLYGDASGKDEWRVRGEKALQKLDSITWKLTIQEGGVQKRNLLIADENISLTISDEGFQ
jgi:hypothetical protein